MDLVRFGLVIRALRRRKGWRQLDVASAAGVSQDTISLIERGRGDGTTLGTLIRVLAGLDARLKIDILWRGGELDRLVDQDHASLGSQLAELLQDEGWSIRLEVSYSIYGERGSIDLLAWHEATRSLLVVEIKTEITSGEATVRKLDEKARLAAGIAVERFGWRASSVSRLLVVAASSTARDRVAAGAALFSVAFPVRTVAVRRWLRAPTGELSGLLFLRNTNDVRRTSRGGGRHRVRRVSVPRRGGGANAAPQPRTPGKLAPEVTILTNRTYDEPGS